MTTPTTLDQWTISAIRDLASKGMRESDAFDFKAQLPDSRDYADKRRLRMSCAAFANRDGGFLIFGVTDPPNPKLVGMDPKVDFPALFGDFPSLVSPSVERNFQNPPLALPSGKVIHVVQVFPSWRAPHAVEEQSNRFVFPKRTNKGNETMDYSEVREMFLSHYEKRLKLQLLRAELEQIRSDAQGMIIEDERNDGTVYGLPNIELRVLEAVLADTYSITQAVPELIAALYELRSRSRMVNNKVEGFRLEVALPMSNRAQIVRDHNDFVRPHCEVIVKLGAAAQGHLDQLAPQ